MQVALLSFESSAAGKVAAVRRAVERCWSDCSILAESLWHHVNGDTIDKQVLHRHCSGLPQLPVSGQKLSRKRLRDMLQKHMQLVRQIEHVERLVAAAESMSRRLPACPALVEHLVEGVVQAGLIAKV